MKRLLIWTCAILLLLCSPAASGLRPNAPNPAYNHDKWKTLPQDHLFEFTAYTVSFDGPDDTDNDPDDNDTDSDNWGIPEWVAFEIHRLEIDHRLASRPKWMTDEALFNAGIAPDDSTYAVSGVNLIKEVKTDYRFVRGHMCPKDTAERISEDAAYNTHTLLNAVPQLQMQNNGIWKELEQLCHDWADTYGRIWVICGPVFFGKSPSMWLGQDGEKKAAIPDALFKIVIRETDGQTHLKALAFLIPNILPRQDQELETFLTSVDRIESLTGLEFITVLEKSDQDTIKKTTAPSLNW